MALVLRCQASGWINVALEKTFLRNSYYLMSEAVNPSLQNNYLLLG